MTTIIIDSEIKLIKYYPNYEAALPWYQDPQLCKQVDNRDTVYDLDLLKAMYQYLDQKVIYSTSSIKTTYVGMCACSQTEKSTLW